MQREHEHVQRFKREARATAALNHPIIVTVHEVGEWEGRPFIATEFVETGDGRILGTPAYMAPEQWAGHRLMRGRISMPSAASSTRY